MADAAGAESSGRHEQVVELRKEASTMALYVAICLLAAFAALPETDAHARVIATIWGVTVGLALAHWFAFRVGTSKPQSTRKATTSAWSAGSSASSANAARVDWPSSTWRTGSSGAGQLANCILATPAVRRGA